ncbi:MAG: HAD family hydrolase [Chloroflexi bacterium]|nr:MAG: HAD family hydrolase [Chloroflexota bacterium]
MPESIQAVIFDLDGTLIDTETADYEACRILFEEIGVPLSLDRWAECVVGIIDGYDCLFDELLAVQNNGLTRAGLRRRLQELWPQTLQHVTLMDGAIEALTHFQAAGYRLGLASASDRSWINRWLTRFQLAPFFEAIASGEEVRRNKPAPDVFLLAAQRLNTPPEACLVFEDSHVGVSAARAAGMTVIAVPNTVTRGMDFSSAHRVIHSLRDITGVESSDWRLTFNL